MMRVIREGPIIPTRIIPSIKEGNNIVQPKQEVENLNIYELKKTGL